MVQENWLQNHLEMMEKYKLDLIGVESWKMSENPRFYPFKKCKNYNEEFNYVGAGGAMIKNEIIKNIGLFDEQFFPAFFEDPDLIFRAYNAGYKIGWNYNNIVEHLPHKLLTSENRQYFMNSWKKFQKKWKDYKMPVFKTE
jgi:GT2 family glycosyltransferase